MQTIKGGWVGQPFALATYNESGSRKTRIRRSKEERKTMVETFIKKHQKLNDGSFPSLNLTHKEVGGSFYTVREIVREIIQENKVLGPAKLPPEEQSHVQFSEQCPSGSISTEPQSLSLSGDTHVISTFAPIHYKNEVLYSSGINGFDHGMFNEQMIGDYETTKENKSDLPNDLSLKQKNTDSQVLDSNEIISEHVNGSLIVGVDDLDSGSIEAASVEKTSEETEHDQDRITSSDKVSQLVNEPVDVTIADPTPEKSSKPLDKKAELKAGEASLEISSVPEKIAAIADDVVAKASSTLTGTVNAASPMLNETLTSSSKNGSSNRPAADKLTEAKGKSTIQQRGGNPPLDRIHLETWKGASAKSKEHEANPVLALLKACITAFMKFWTEE